jgi:Spy/CpxP family protein refolding chaperone
MNIKPIRAGTTAFIAIAALIALPVMAASQHESNPTPPAEQTGEMPKAPNANDENTVQSFAVALAEVQDIKVEYTEKIKSVKEPEVSGLLQREAQVEMVKAVQKKGFSVDQYNSLARQMQTDAEFRGRVERAMPKK